MTTQVPVWVDLLFFVVAGFMIAGAVFVVLEDFRSASICWGLSLALSIHRGEKLSQLIER